MERDLEPAVESDAEEVETVAGKRRFDRLSTHGTTKDALAAMQLRDGQRYVWCHNQGSQSRTAVYRCASHAECPKFIRLVGTTDSDGRDVYALEESGIHGDVKGKGKRGISPAISREVDATLSGGAGPQECHLLLTGRYANNPIMFALVPTEAQLKNRKATLSKTESGGEIKSMAAINEWASGKECRTLSEFLGHDDASPGDEIRFDPALASEMDELIVLKVVQVRDSIAIVLSSRRLLLNIKKAALGQSSEGVFGAADGTYKLHFGGWTLVNFGTFCTRFTRGS